jgi:hypothetical protein
MPREITIIIGGDTAPTRINESLLSDGEAREVFNQVMDVFLSADLVAVNLECPLTQHNRPIQKAGPNLKAKPETISGLVNAGINVFSLANNHIMDYGVEGYQDTIGQIAGKKAHYNGVGDNLTEAKKYLSLAVADYRVAILSVAEHEFSIATDDTPGANPFDPFITMEDIGQAKERADIVIVLYHGGIEYYPLPSPCLQRICRKMVQAGADYIICQHSHCIGSYERYQGSYIVYGQGNLLFDYFNNEMTRSGVLIKITANNNASDIEFIPIVKRNFAVDLAGEGERESILQAFDQRSRKLSEAKFIREEWKLFVESRKYRYLQSFLGFNKLVRRIDNRLGNLLVKALLNRQARLYLADYINCESHLEVIQSLLKENC